MKKYKAYFSDKRFLISIAVAFGLFCISMVANYFADSYATLRASSSVTDIILNNIPVFNVDEIFLYGPVVFWAFVCLLLLYEPNKIPFALKSIALFVIIRSVFVTLTHIGPFPDQINIFDSPSILQKIIFGGDLFFSAHTGLPFLMALVFHKNKKLLVIFTASAIFFGVIVLIAHLHYSIDVLSAFFITYTIYSLASIFWKHDKKIFEYGLNGVK